MLENLDQQRTALNTREERDFVTAVRDSIVTMNPKLGDDPALLDRLARAYGEAKRMGLTRDESLAEFVYLEIELPGFCRQPSISKWL